MFLEKIKKLFLSKDRLYNKFGEFINQDHTDQEFDSFLQKNISYFTNLNINPWELFFFSRLNQEIDKNQYIRLLYTFDKFIKRNSLNFSLNNNFKKHNYQQSIFVEVFHWGYFPFHNQNYSIKFLKNLKKLGLYPNNQELEYLRELLDGYEAKSMKTHYRWNLKEFNKIYNKAYL